MIQLPLVSCSSISRTLMCSSPSAPVTGRAGFRGKARGRTTASAAAAMREDPVTTDTHLTRPRWRARKLPGVGLGAAGDGSGSDAAGTAGSTPGTDGEGCGGRLAGPGAETPAGEGCDDTGEGP